jgi:hypothetical protein
MSRSTRVLVLGAVVAALFASCAPAATSSPATGTFSPAASAGPAPTIPPVFGLTWGLVDDVERPQAAFAIPSDLPTAPTGPGTAGHPGHFPGQSVVADVTLSGDRLVAVGYTAFEGAWTADAWTSMDGSHWSLAHIDGRSPSFAEAITSRGDGTFVAVGRVGSTAAAWASPDGIHWTSAEVTPAATGPRDAERMTSVITTAEGLVAAGSTGPELGSRRARFWTSADGATWTRAPDSEAFADTEVTAIVALGDALIALGRIGDGQRGTGSVAWRSTDARTWARIDDPALAGGLAVAVAAAPDGSGLVAVGSDVEEREAVAWVTPDGQAWTRAPREESRLHSAEKIRLTDVVATAAGYVAVGNFVGFQYGTAASWLSADGLTWVRAPRQAALEGGEPEAVIAWLDRLVIVGSRGAPDDYIPSVWISPNVP